MEGGYGGIPAGKRARTEQYCNYPQGTDYGGGDYGGKDNWGGAESYDTSKQGGGGDYGGKDNWGGAESYDTSKQGGHISRDRYNTRIFQGRGRGGRRSGNSRGRGRGMQRGRSLRTRGGGSMNFGGNRGNYKSGTTEYGDQVDYGAGATCFEGEQIQYGEEETQYGDEENPYEDEQLQYDDQSVEGPDDGSDRNDDPSLVDGTTIDGKRSIIRPIPLGPFNEGVPTAFRSAVPSSYHRGVICKQDVTLNLYKEPDEESLAVAVVMGQEVEEQSSETDRTGRNRSRSKHRGKQKTRQKDGNITDNRYKSRVSLPAMQFVGRDNRDLSSICSFGTATIPCTGSTNDLSDDDADDLLAFEVPLYDLQGDHMSTYERLNSTVKGGVVFNSKGAVICKDESLSPKTFLHCHICDKRGFQGLGQYKEHLQGDMHAALRAMHVEKLQAGLAYMRAGAKKAEVRLAMGLLRSAGDSSSKMRSFCDVCGCNVLITKLHLQLPQHRLVENFMFPVCCGQKFGNRVEYEDHRVLPVHLREVFKGRLSLMCRLQDGKLINDEQYQALPEFLRLLKSNCLVNDDNNTANLTPYDPDRPNVVKMLKYYGVIQCLCCNKSFGRQEQEQLFEHVHSLAHYEASVLYVTQRERVALREQGAGEILYPQCVVDRSRKVIKIAKALVTDAREKADNVISKRTRVMKRPKRQLGSALRVLLVDGEPVLRDGEPVLVDGESESDSEQQEKDEPSLADKMDVEPRVGSAFQRLERDTKEDAVQEQEAEH